VCYTCGNGTRTCQQQELLHKGVSAPSAELIQAAEEALAELKRKQQAPQRKSQKKRRKGGAAVGVPPTPPPPPQQQSGHAAAAAARAAATAAAAAARSTAAAAKRSASGHVKAGTHSGGKRKARAISRGDGGSGTGARHMMVYLWCTRL
jgi:hypothetical protein